MTDKEFGELLDKLWPSTEFDDDELLDESLEEEEDD
jgi:hypothetical protein